MIRSEGASSSAFANTTAEVLEHILYCRSDKCKYTKWPKLKIWTKVRTNSYLFANVYIYQIFIYELVIEQ